MLTSHPNPLGTPQGLASADFELIVRRLADDLAFGSDPSLFTGAGIEYASSRPYQPGDPVRQLNWRLTARSDRPYVKEYEAMKRVCTHIVVDTSASMSVRSTPVSKHDLAVWIAGALGLASLRRLSPVTVVAGGERTTPFVPSLLRSDLWRAIEPLRAGSLSEKTRLGERLSRLRASAPTAGLVIVLSDLHDPGAVPALRHVAQRHDCMVVHLLDPAEEGTLEAGFFRGREAETGRRFLGWSGARWSGLGQSRASIVACGIDVLTLRTDLPFIAPLRHFLASRAGITRGRR